MSIIVEKAKDIFIISPEIRLSIKERMDFENKIIDVTKKGNFKILVDFERTKYIDSSCLGVIAGFVTKLRADGGDIRLCCTNNNILKILKMTNLHTVIKIYEDKKSAIKDFTG